MGKWDSLQRKECDAQDNEETGGLGAWQGEQIMPVCVLTALSEAAEINPPGSCYKRRQKPRAASHFGINLEEL